MSVAGMKILVTGASSGIGAHIAQFLVRAGAQVAVAARRIETLEDMATDAGPEMHAVAMDVQDSDSVKAGCQSAAEKLGGLDGVFANAGIAWGGHALSMPQADWGQVIDVNVNGVFRTCQACAPLMSKGGAMLITASVLSFRPGEKVAAYATSKGAVLQLTKSLALEWAPRGIRVNAIAPGYFPTEMTGPFLATEKGQALTNNVPMGRFGELPELEGPVELLLGTKGSFITGATLPVDGGHLCQSV